MAESSKLIMGADGQTYTVVTPHTAAPVVYKPGLVQIKPQYSPDVDTGNHPMHILWWLQRSPVSLTLPNLATIANTFDTNWSTVFQSYGATSQQYVGCTVQDYSSSTGLVATTVGTFGGAPGTHGESMPPNTAILLSLKTTEHYRGGHFRTYLPWVGNTCQLSTDPSKITSAIQTAVINAFGTVEPAMNGISVGGGLTQRCYRNRTSPTLSTLYPINTYFVQQLLATQRRRLRKAPHH